MIDLKKLEDNLDKALANETKESLTNWLNVQRNMKNEKTIHSKKLHESRKVEMAEMYIKEQDAVNKTCNRPHVKNCTTCKLADAIYDEKCCKCDRTYSMWEQR